MPLQKCQIYMGIQSTSTDLPFTKELPGTSTLTSGLYQFGTKIRTPQEWDETLVGLVADESLTASTGCESVLGQKHFQGLLLTSAHSIVLSPLTTVAEFVRIVDHVPIGTAQTIVKSALSVPSSIDIFVNNGLPHTEAEGSRQILAAASQVASLLRQGTAVLVGSAGSSLTPRDAQYSIYSALASHLAPSRRRLNGVSSSSIFDPSVVSAIFSDAANTSNVQVHHTILDIAVNMTVAETSATSHALGVTSANASASDSQTAAITHLVAAEKTGSNLADHLTSLASQVAQGTINASDARQQYHTVDRDAILAMHTAQNVSLNFSTFCGDQAAKNYISFGTADSTSNVCVYYSPPPSPPPPMPSPPPPPLLPHNEKGKELEPHHANIIAIVVPIVLVVVALIACGIVYYVRYQGTRNGVRMLLPDVTPSIKHINYLRDGEVSSDLSSAGRAQVPPTLGLRSNVQLEGDQMDLIAVDKSRMSDAI